MPEVYTSKDANAPVLTNEKGSFNNLLKIVLTQGYGEKEAAGWTVAFEDADNDKVAFKNAGIGYFLRFAYNSQGRMDVNSYESMTDVNNGTNGSSTYQIDYYADKTQLDWVVVADNKSFYFYAKDIKRIWFFGDFPSFIPGELWNFGISMGCLQNYNSLIDAMRKMSGEQEHISLQLLGNPFGSSYFGGINNTIGYPYYGNVFISKPVLLEGNNPRGVLCGLTDFKHKKEYLVTSIGINGWAIKEIEGVNYIFFETYYGAVAIDLDNWWSIK